MRNLHRPGKGALLKANKTLVRVLGEMIRRDGPFGASLADAGFGIRHKMVDAEIGFRQNMVDAEVGFRQE